MGRKLSNTMLKSTPVISLTKTVGGSFTGVLLDLGNERKMKKGKQFVYTFKVVTSDMDASIKDENGKYVDYAYDAAEKVSVFAPTVLHKALQSAKIGEQIKIVYLGKVNDSYHNFDVEVVE